MYVVTIHIYYFCIHNIDIERGKFSSYVHICSPIRILNAMISERNKTGNLVVNFIMKNEGRNETILLLKHFA